MIFYAEEHGPSAYILRVTNMSDEPIWDIMIAAQDKHGKLVSASKDPGMVLPTGSAEHPNNLVFGAVLFRDNSGRRWHRDTEGHLDELGSWWRRRVHRYNMWRRQRARRP